MSAENNRATALKFLEEYGKYNPAVLDMLDEGIQWKVMCDRSKLCPLAGTNDKAAIEAGLAGNKASMPEGIQFDIIGSTAEGNQVAVEAESLAKVANEKKDIYQNVYHFIFTFNDSGKITYIGEYCDTYYATAIFVGI